jgi:hypothetical protein
MVAVTVNSVKEHAIVDGGAGVTITFAAQYVREHSLKMPASCIDELIGALTRIQSELNRPAGKAREAAPAPQQSAAPVPQRQQSAPAPQGAEPAAAPPVPSGNIAVRRPKNCIVGAETKAQKLVLMVFDFQTPHQAGFGLDPQGAKALAVDLVKNADVVLAAGAGG